MSTFLTAVFVVLAIVALLSLMVLFWARSKMCKAKAYLIYSGLALTVQALKERAAKPGNAADQELAAQLKRAEAAKASAKKAFEKGNLDEAIKIMVPVFDEVAKYKNALDQERARQAAEVAAHRPTDVIDAEFHVVEPVLQLPAPTDSRDDSKM